MKRSKRGGREEERCGVTKKEDEIWGVWQVQGELISNECGPRMKPSVVREPVPTWRRSQ